MSPGSDYQKFPVFFQVTLIRNLIKNVYKTSQILLLNLESPLDCPGNISVSIPWIFTEVLLHIKIVQNLL